MAQRVRGGAALRLVAGLLAVALVSAVDADAGPTGTVAGVVRDAVTTTVLPGVTVSALQGSTTVGQTTTNSSGAYSLSLAPGTYNLSFSRTGYVTGTETGVSVVRGQTTTADFSLTPLPPTTGQLSGAVRDAQTSVGIVGATVRAKQGAATVATTTTGAAGAYSITALQPGSYDVEASAVGYRNATVPAQSVTAGSTTVVDLVLAPDVTPPSVPAGVNATAASSSSISLTWLPSTDDVGVTAYLLYRDGVLHQTLSATSYLDEGLSPVRTYCYTVRAKDAAGNTSAASSSACATTPAAPVVATAVNPFHYCTSSTGWTSLAYAVDGSNNTYATTPTKDAVLACSYSEATPPPKGAITKVELGFEHSATSPDGNDGIRVTPWFLNGGSNRGTTTAVFPSAGTDAVVWVNVTADPAGPGATNWTWADVSQLRAEVQAAIAGKRTVATWRVDYVQRRVTYNADVVAPSVPPNVRVTAQSDTSVTLAWDASTDDFGVSGYKIYRDGVYRTTRASYQLSHTETVQAGRIYRYQVSAVDHMGNESALSPQVSVKTDNQPPSVPQNVSAMSVGETSIAIQWSDSTDNYYIKEYSVYFGNGRSPVTVVWPTRSYNDTGLLSGKTYTYRVAAVDHAENVSAPSSELRVTTLVLRPNDDDDGDGVINGLDLCPGTAAGQAVNADGCSVYQSDDTDGDGISNYVERKLGADPVDLNDSPTETRYFQYRASGALESATTVGSH